MKGETFLLLQANSLLGVSSTPATSRDLFLLPKFPIIVLSVSVPPDSLSSYLCLCFLSLSELTSCCPISFTPGTSDLPCDPPIIFNYFFSLFFFQILSTLVLLPRLQTFPCTHLFSLINSWPLFLISYCYIDTCIYTYTPKHMQTPHLVCIMLLV